MCKDYYCRILIDLGFYPNYSFEVGDIDGDGCKEIAAISTDGNILKVYRINGKLLFKRSLNNNGCWGTIIFSFGDLDNDGKEELIVPDGHRVIALDEDNNIVRKFKTPGNLVDDYGVAIPLIGVFKRNEDSIGICVAIAGGTVIALDEDFKPLWIIKNLRKDFGHEFYFGRNFRGEGDVIAFLSVDHIRYASPKVEGDLIIVDSKGRIIFKKRVRDLIDDTHFDDIAIADFRGRGEEEILVEKGFLLDFKGNVIWDSSNLFDHGQWIAHMPNPIGPGRISFISELWGYEGKSRMLDPNGETLWIFGKHRYSIVDQKSYPGYGVTLTRVHAVDWKNIGEYEVIFAEQIVRHRNAPQIDVKCRLKIFVFNPLGKLLAEIPFHEIRRKDFFYNGEVHSRVTDIDGDGLMEYVFPCQNGKVIVVGKNT